MTIEKYEEVSIPDILQEADTVAIIGCSDNPYRTSYHIAEYLQQQGYRIIPINPKLDGKQLFGEVTYDSVQQIPSGITVDIMVIFRNKRYSAGSVREVAEWSQQTGQKPVVWTQLDVSSDEAEEVAREAELPYIKNRCIHAEHGHIMQ